MQNTRSARLLLSTGLAALAMTGSATAQSLIAYGQGTAGTGGKVPFLWATSTPRPGNANYGVTIDRGLPNATAATYLSLNSADFTIGGVRVLIDFSASLPLGFAKLDASGAATYKLPLPNQASIIGLQVYHQAFVADAGGAALGFSATQGLDVRVTDFGVLIGTRSTGKADPQIAINLDTGKQSSFSQASMTNVDIPDMYPRSRTHCLVGSGRSNRVALFDCQVFPPKFVKDFAPTGTPWAVNFHPDGLRAYIVNQSTSTGTPQIDVVWGHPALPNFGTMYPGGNIALGSLPDALRIEFTSSGDFGILTTLGLFGSGADIRKYDTKTGSPNYHKVVGNLLTSGQLIWDSCMIDDDTYTFNMSGFGSQSMVKLLDINTMKVTKTFGPAQFGSVVRGMVADPRGRYLYVGNNPATLWNVPAGILRINVDKSDPNFGKITNIAAGFSNPAWGTYDVEISDAGDRLYAIIGAGIQTSFVGAIVEYDTATLKVTRTWSMNGLGNLYNLAIR